MLRRSWGKIALAMSESDPTSSMVPRPVGVNRAREGTLERVGRAAGIVAGIVGTLTCGLGVVGAALDQSPGALAGRIVGSVVFTGFGAASALLTRRLLRRQGAASAAARAQAEAGLALAATVRDRLLAVASRYQGRLTVAELAAELAIAPEPAAHALDGAVKASEAVLL